MSHTVWSGKACHHQHNNTCCSSPLLLLLLLLHWAMQSCHLTAKCCHHSPPRHCPHHTTTPPTLPAAPPPTLPPIHTTNDADLTKLLLIMAERRIWCNKVNEWLLFFVQQMMIFGTHNYPLWSLFHWKEGTFYSTYSFGNARAEFLWQKCPHSNIEVEGMFMFFKIFFFPSFWLFDLKPNLILIDFGYPL